MSGGAFKKIMLGALALVLVAIWVRNFFLFVPAARIKETHDVTNQRYVGSVKTSETSSEVSFSLDEDFRDPFSLPKKSQPKVTTPSRTAQVLRPVETIRASLLGHVLNSQQPYIVVFDSVTSQSNLLRTGDSLNGFTLKKISRSEVQWTTRKGRRIVWNIDQ